jgi:TetR/AcrR family fatty acid metabolism transcriptional regulator
MMSMALSSDRRSSAAIPGSSLRQEKREIILDAAIKVFAQTGYHGARVSDIAREAGIAYGLVYHYFKNKEEILHSIFEERWSGFLEAVETIADSPRVTEPAQIRAMGRLFQLIARILRRGQEAGEIRKDLDPEVACTVFLGALELSITSLVLRVVKIEGEDREIEEYYSRVARTVVEICMNGMTSSRPDA